MENMYSLAAGECNAFIKKELHSRYRRAGVDALMDINDSNFDCLAELELLDHSRSYALKDPHCLMTDHKPNFASNSSIRLICPTKSDLVRVSMGILSRIIGLLRDKLMFPYGKIVVM